MIAKAKKIIGLPVFTINTGEESGKVKDVIYDPYQNRVTALLLDEEGLFSDERVLMYEDINSIGKDAVLTESKTLIKKIKDISEEIKEIINGNTNLTGHRIITEEGKDLGKATDILFDTQSGAVKEFEVTGGTFEILSSGKKVVPIRGIKTIGKDAVIVDEMTEHIIDEQAQHQGAQGAINKAQDSIGQAGDTVQQALSDAREKIEHSAHEIKNDPKNQERIETLENTAQRIKRQTQSKVDQIKNQAKETKQSDEFRDVKDASDQAWYETKQTLQGRLGGLKQYTQEVADRKRKRVDNEEIRIPRRQRD